MMSARLLSCISLVALCSVASQTAVAAGAMVIPGYGAAEAQADGMQAAPSYRADSFPPANSYGQPTYRDTPFPPQPARVAQAPAYQRPEQGAGYGGGFIEYMMTGHKGRGATYNEPDPAGARSAYGQAPRPYASGRTDLVQSSLPDYQPQPPASFGRRPAYGAQAYAGQAVDPRAAAPDSANYDPLANDPGLASRPMNPIYNKQDVAYSGTERPGTIIIDTPNKFLFLVQPGGRALRYGIGVGRPGFSWAGVKTISRKAEWPEWTPPPEMLLRRPDLPHHMNGGPENPLGARAMYLGSTLYRIHGTNEPYTIGTNVSSGCIRLRNEDVTDLYDRVSVGARVIVM